jgi:hypothetical protein
MLLIKIVTFTLLTGWTGWIFYLIGNGIASL